MKKDEVFKRIREKILELMKKEGTDWTKSWIATATPLNFLSKKEYRGINNFWLSVQGFDSNEWGTFKQWQSKGYRIKKGSSATPIIFSEMREKTLDRLSDDEKARYEETGVMPKFWLLRSYNVFNADQIEAYVSENTKVDHKETISSKDLEAVIRFIAATKAEIKHEGDRAYYHQILDEITMPVKEKFFSDEDYYSVLLHELTHWTMHEDRTNRQDKDLSYAQEELVAELGSAFLCRLLNVSKTVRPDHAKYLNNWIEAIEDSEKAMVQAFSDAQKAVDYLTKLQTKMEKAA